jgi:hypothetical protein
MKNVEVAALMIRIHPMGFLYKQPPSRPSLTSTYPLSTALCTEIRVYIDLILKLKGALDVKFKLA